jgi:hypothetical protein
MKQVALSKTVYSPSIKHADSEGTDWNHLHRRAFAGRRHQVQVGAGGRDWDRGLADRANSGAQKKQAGNCEGTAHGTTSAVFNRLQG